MKGMLLTMALVTFTTMTQAEEKKIFADQCAYGLANGESVITECKTRMTFENDEVLCFSSRDARDLFLQDPKGNLTKAEENYKK